MKKIITIGGSNSKNSINKKLAEYAGNQLENVEMISIDLNRFEMPLFSIDLELEKGFPEKAVELNKIINEVDGFIISLAEHNGAYSAVFKNTFDWLSRINSKVWRDKPMLLLATSPGTRGGKTVLEIASNRFPYHGAKIINTFSLPSFNENFKDIEIVNGDLKIELQRKIDQFAKEL